MLSLRRIAISLLAGVLLFFLLMELSLTAAAEWEESRTGGFPFVSRRSEWECQASEPYYYAPLLSLSHSIARHDGTAYNSGTCCPKVFRLLTTTESSPAGEKPTISIAVYCIDAGMDIQENVSYRAVNLEDGTGLDEDTAGKIRAILTQSFPRKNVRAIQARANAWLRCQGLPQIRNLQSAEAILATQAAIWTLTGGEGDTIHSLYSGQMPMEQRDLQILLGKTAEDDTSMQRETAYTAANVESLFRYFCSLAPEEPRCELLPGKVFQRPVCTIQEQRKETSTVTVHFFLDLKTNFRSRLVLSASCDGEIQSRTVSEAGEYEFVFQSRSENPEIILELTGEQYTNDVYLFLSEQIESQAFAGFSSGMVPVHSQTVLQIAGAEQG